MKVKRTFEKDLRELIENELKEREIKITRDIDDFLTKPVTVPSANMDNVGRNKALQTKEYLYKFLLYLKDHKNDLKKSNTRKIYLTIAISCISSDDTHEEHLTCSKSDTIEISISDKADEN